MSSTNILSFGIASGGADAFGHRWFQSDRIKVLVGGAVKVYLVPREFLRRRSRIFRTRIDQRLSGLSLLDVQPDVFERFLLWAANPNPSIDPQTTPEELEEQALFAEEYEVVALQHQAADKFDQQFVSGDWVLQPEMLPPIYQRCGPQSPLRRVFHAALMLVRKERHVSEEDRWSNLVDEGGELAADVYKAGLHAHTEDDFGVSGVRNIDACRFHNHSQQSVPVDVGKAKRAARRMKSECPYRVLECFPDEVAKEEYDGGPPPPAADEAEPGPTEEFAASDAALAAPAEEELPAAAEEALATAEEPGAYDEPGVEAVAVRDESAAAEPEPEACIDDWAIPKKSKKEKKKKGKSILAEEAPVEEAPVDEQFKGWERLE